MLQRIKAILEFKALSATGFADTIGIARPVMSHILSGRNKPSLEVVQKILKAFPDLSVPWLVLGEGQMLKKADKPVEEVPQAEQKNKPETASASKIDLEENQAKVQKEKSESEPVKRKEAVEPVAEKILILFSDHTFQEYEKRS